MSIIFAGEEARGKNGTVESVFGGGDDDRVFNIVTNSLSDTKETITLSGVLPSVGSPHPNNFLSSCRSLNFERVGKFLWRVTARYSTKPESQTDREKRDVQAPTFRLPKIIWESVERTKSIAKDQDGNAIVNSAGDYFDPPPEVEDTRWIVHVAANVDAKPPGFRLLAGAINEAAFTIDDESVGVEEARIIRMRVGEWEFESGEVFRRLEYSMEINEAGWELELLDQGFRYKDGTDLKDILIEDEDGNFSRPSAPLLLNGSGDKLANPSNTTAKFLNFDVFRIRHFAVLPGINL